MRSSLQKSIFVRFVRPGGLMFTRWVWALDAPPPLVVTYRSGVPALPGFSEMTGAEAIPVPMVMLRGGVVAPVASAPAPDVAPTPYSFAVPPCTQGLLLCSGVNVAT